MVVCGRCGFGYADGIPTQGEFDAYYARMSKYEHAREGGREGAFADQRFPAAAAFIGAAVPLVHARVLDVGCSNGGLLHALAEAGFDDLLGLDPSPASARAAQRLYGLRVLTGTLSAPPPEAGPAELVLLSAVLEHIRDLRDALWHVRGLLAPQGRVYVEVPDVKRFGSTPDAPFQEFSVEHVNYFSRRSLRNLMAGAGFEEVQSTTITTIQGEHSTADVIMAVFTPSDGLAIRSQPDHETGPALEAYVASSAVIERSIHAALDPVVANGRPIVVWGVGTHTQRLLAESPLGRARIAAFVDSNPRYQGGELHGAPVVGPEALAGRDEPILISSRFYQTEIERQIRRDLGLTNEIILLYDV